MSNLPRIIHLKKEKPDIVVCFSFGVRKDNVPGLSNKDIASQAIQIALQYKILILAQWEVALVIQQMGYEYLIAGTAELDGEMYINSSQVWEKLKKFMVTNNWRKVAIVANEIHVLRLTLLVVGLSQANCLSLSHVYDPLSTQSWTQNRFGEILHEISLIRFLFDKRLNPFKNP